MVLFQANHLAFSDDYEDDMFEKEDELKGNYEPSPPDSSPQNPSSKHKSKEPSTDFQGPAPQKRESFKESYHAQPETEDQQVNRNPSFSPIKAAEEEKDETQEEKEMTKDEIPKTDTSVREPAEQNLPYQLPQDYEKKPVEVSSSNPGMVQPSAQAYGSQQYPIPRPQQARPQTQQQNQKNRGNANISYNSNSQHSGSTQFQTSPFRNFQNGPQMNSSQPLQQKANIPVARQLSQNKGVQQQQDPQFQEIPNFRSGIASDVGRSSGTASSSIPQTHHNFKLQAKLQNFNQNFHSADKSQQRGRREVIQQIIQNNRQEDQPPFLYGNQNAANSANSNSKRRRLRDYIYGQYQTQFGGYIEREDLQHERRKLKMQMNSVSEENIRLRTKLTQFYQEINKKDKEIEGLTLRLQQSMNFAHQHPSSMSSQSAQSQLFESFLVSQLKRQLREVKQEVSEKDSLIEQLRRDIKLSKAAEMEVELNQYIEECKRLRQMVEVSILDQRNMSKMELEIKEQQELEEQARIEEAFYQKELQLQLELQNKQNLEAMLNNEKLEKEKLNEKLKNQDLKIKKINEIISENKRKAKIIADKSKECQELRDEVLSLRSKAKDRDSIYQKNKELVTKQFQQQSSIDSKEKRIGELQQQNGDLLEQLRALQKLVDGKGAVGQGSQQQQQKQIPKPGNQKMLMEILFRHLKGERLVAHNDTMQMKNFYNNNRIEIDIEVESLKELQRRMGDGKQEWREVVALLKARKDALQKCIQQRGRVAASVGEVEKMLEELGVAQKDWRKHLAFNVVLKESKAVNQLQIDRIMDLLGQNLSTAEHNPSHLEQPKFESEQIDDSKHNTHKHSPERHQPKQSNPLDESRPDLSSKSQANRSGRQEQDRSRGPTEQQEESYLKEEFEQEVEQEQPKSPELNKNQISEEQMLQIAENVFKIIADKITEKGVSLRKLFKKKIKVVEEFDNETNVEIVEADDFLEIIEQKLQINDLPQLDIACLMQVLSKPELNHAIVLGEIEMVMNNFGIVEEHEEKPSQDEIQEKKKKQSKWKQLQALIQEEQSDIYTELAKLLDSISLSRFQELIESKSYSSNIKAKGKAMTIKLINKGDLVELLQEECGAGLSDQTWQQVAPYLWLDSKYTDMFQFKTIMKMATLVQTRKDKESQEKHALDDFYKPNQQINDNQNESSKQGGTSGPAGEVINFESLMNDDEEENYTEEQFLNPIQEDNEEGSSPLLWKKEKADS